MESKILICLLRKREGKKKKERKKRKKERSAISAFEKREKKSNFDTQKIQENNFLITPRGAKIAQQSK